VEGPECKNIEIQGLFKENGSIESWIDPTAAATVDRAVDVVYESMVDQPLKSNRYAILIVHHRLHSPGRVRAGRGGECAGVRRRAIEARRRGPKSCHMAPNRPRAGSMRSWSNCARNQAKKTRPRRSRRPTPKGGSAGLAGATMRVKVKEWWEGEAYHPETEKMSLLARKKLRWRRLATAASSERHSGR
jgi:hypothetical protein